jgi:hypothetical protein
MNIEIIPESLLHGEHFHCRPIKGGPIVEAPIVRSEDESTPTIKVAIICPQWRPSSKCGLRDKPGVRGPRYCFWYRGDSLGVYQIIGPGMDKKSDEGYEQG